MWRSDDGRQETRCRRAGYADGVRDFFRPPSSLVRSKTNPRVCPGGWSSERRPEAERNLFVQRIIPASARDRVSALRLLATLAAVLATLAGALCLLTGISLLPALLTALTGPLRLLSRLLLTAVLAGLLIALLLLIAILIAHECS